MSYTIQQFRKDYPNDAACLDKLFQLRFGDLEACPFCSVANPVFRRLNTRRAYQCRDCYHQIYPTAGTIFQKTNIPLTYWFYAMYLMTVTRNGVSAKELERTLGITYKSAFRMAKLIRELMGRRKKTKLKRTVEMDETYVGGLFERHRGRNNEKIPVFAMVERRGEVIACKVDDVCSLLLLSVLSFSQNYKKGDVVYKISIGADIKWGSQIELVLRQKAILIRNSNTPNDPFKYDITKKIALADSSTSRYNLSSEYGFKGYILINELKKEIFLVEDNQNPGYIFILRKEKY